MSIPKTLAMRSLEIVDELQEWIESFEGLSTIPIVSVTFTQDTESISIGEINVYCSEMGFDCESLIEHCKTEFLKECGNMARFVTPAQSTSN